jgi:hypothetical protein
VLCLYADSRGGNAIHATVDAVEEAYVIKDNTSSDGIRVQVNDEAEFTKKVGPTEGPHTMEEFDHATVDGEVTVAEEEFEGVQVPVEIKPEVDKDEEGGGDVTTPDDKEAGKLGITMTKQGCFAHGGEGGGAKCMQLRSCNFLLVVNAASSAHVVEAKLT